MILIYLLLSFAFITLGAFVLARVKNSLRLKKTRALIRRLGKFGNALKSGEHVPEPDFGGAMRIEFSTPQEKAQNAFKRIRGLKKTEARLKKIRAELIFRDPKAEKADREIAAAEEMLKYVPF